MPKLATFSYMANKFAPIHGGTCHISIQQTALQCRRKGISCGLHKTPQGRPLKIKANSSFQTKWGWSEHNKRKRNLQLNEKLNQANYNKHETCIFSYVLCSPSLLTIMSASMSIQVKKGYTLNLRSLQWVISTHKHMRSWSKIYSCTFRDYVQKGCIR